MSEPARARRRFITYISVLQQVVNVPIDAFGDLVEELASGYGIPHWCLVVFRRNL